MPDFVRCPHCGCGVALAAVPVGQMIRCFACNHRFVPERKADQPAAPLPALQPLAPSAQPEPRTTGRDNKVLCPICGTAVGWQLGRCPLCREEFLDELPPVQKGRHPGPRRDSEPHRGNLIASLGKVSLLLGILPLFTCGLASLVAWPLALTTWILAENQLKRIDAGLVDESGRTLTESGKEQALIGMVLSTVFGAGFGLAWWFFR
jgi:hypothetical protein